MKNYLYTLLFLSLATIGCKKDFLDRVPLDQYSNTVLWKTSNDALAALNGCYSFWGGGPAAGFSNNGYYFSMADCNSDNAYNQFPWESWETSAAGIATPTNIGFNKYTPAYKTIQVCNWFMANIGAVNMDNTLKATMTGEARFLRAYEYFMLSQLYGNVPLVLNNVSIDSANLVAQSTKADIVQFILTELSAISQDLPVSYSGADLGRITSGAAIALKARVELYNQMYDACITDCQQLMKPPFTYSINPSYINLFRATYANNPEVILNVQFKSNDNPAQFVRNITINSLGGYCSSAPTQSLVDSYETTSGKTIDDVTSGYDPLQPYKNRDPRLEATVFYPGSPFTSNLGYGIYYDPLSENPKTVDHWGDNNCSPTAYGERKYTQVIADFPDDRNNASLTINLIRFADILLMDAEAKIETNKIDASVYSDINAVRTRTDVNLPPVDQSIYNTQEKLRTLVRRERRVEFALEGLRWFDIQRWKIGETVMNGQVNGSLQGSVNQADGSVVLTPGTTIKVGAPRSFTAGKNYLWPLPQSEIDLNKNLVQNPGY